MDLPTRYEYKTLLGHRDIRLVALQPDSDDAPLRFEVQHHPLDLCPRYFALSYVGALWTPGSM